MNPKETLAFMQADPDYRALSMGAQFYVANTKLNESLQQDQDFMALDPATQEYVRNQLLAQAPTFEDPAFEQRLKAVANQYLTGKTTADNPFLDSEYKQAQGDVNNYTFIEGAIQGSGILSWLRSTLSPQTKNDSIRGLEYFKTIEAQAGKPDYAATLGSLTTSLAEAIGISALLTPVSGALAKGAMTGLRLSPVATGVGALEKAVVLHPALESIAKIGADAIVTAAPYFIAEDLKRTTNNMPSLFTEDMGEVASVLGQNAAINFGVGTIGLGVLGTVAKLGKIVFSPKTTGELLRGTYEQQENAIQAWMTSQDPVLLDKMAPFDRARALQRKGYLDFLKEGVADPDTYLLQKNQFLAQNTSRVLEQTDQGYKIWEWADDGSVKQRDYLKLNEASDYLSYKTYEEWQLLPPEKQSLYPSNGLQFALQRGETLNKQQNLLLAFDGANPDAKVVALGSQAEKALKRPVITKAEADALSASTESGIGIQANIDLEMFRQPKGRSIFSGQPSMVVSKSDNPNAFFIGVNRATPDEYAYVEKQAQEAIQKNPALSIEEAKASIMMDHGKDFFEHADGSFEFFNLRNAKLIGSIEDIASIPRGAKTLGSARSQIIVEQEGRQILKGESFSTNQDAVLKATVQAIRSTGTEDLRKTALAYLEGFQKTVDLKVERSPNLQKVQLFRQENGSYILRFPEKITSPQQEQQLVKELFDNFKTLTKNAKGSHKGTYYADQLSKNAERFGLGPDFDSKQWVNYVTEKLGGKALIATDGITLSFGKTVRRFASIDESVNFLAKKTLDQNLLKRDLLLQGLRFGKDKSGFFVINPKTGKTWTATELPDLLNKINYEPQFIDRLYGSQATRLLPDGSIELTFANVKIVKSYDQASKLLSKFKDTEQLAREKTIHQTDLGTIANDPTGNIRVYLSKWGIQKDFSSLSDARKFFEYSPRFDDLEQLAAKKGFDFIPQPDGTFKLKNSSETLVARNYDELAEQMSKRPDLEDSVGNILDELDPQIEMDVKSAVASFKKADIRQASLNANNKPPVFLIDANARDVSMWMRIREFTSQKTAWFRDIAQSTNRPNLLKLFNRVQEGRRLAHSDSYVAGLMARKVFETDSGKLMNETSRQKIFYYVGRQNSEAAKALEAQYAKKFGTTEIELTPDELRAAGRLEDFYDKMRIKAGINLKDMIYKYQPLLRDNAHNAQFLASNPTAEDLARSVFGDKLPKEVKFWAEYERSGEIFNYDVKDDPLELLLRYSSQMHKKLYLNTVWKDLYEYLKLNPSANDGPIMHQLNIFREQIMGYYHSTGEKVVEDVGKSFGKALKNIPGLKGFLKDVSPERAEALGKNMFRTGMSLTYLVQMGWRPWVAIRNVLQPFTTLSMRFGLQHTMQAYEDVSKLGKEYFEHLRTIGVLVDQPPVVDELISSGSKLGKVVESSLQWIKNSDDLTRAVAYRTATLRFENALKFRGVRPTDDAAFLKLSGLSVIDPTTAKTIFEQVRAGKVEVAKDSFAMYVTRDTMFPADSADASLMRSGLVGKLFGQYGTYSEAYRANMFSMLKYGSAAERIRMVGTYLGICAAMTAAFAALNIKTNDFVPVLPAIFTGGPNFYAALDLIQTGKLASNYMSGNWTGYDSLQLQKTGRELLGLVPTSYQVRYFQKAQEYFDAGDSYRGYLSLTGIPTIPPNR
jgi:hypothetical protein